MAHQFARIAFTPGVRQLQADRGSRDGYARMDEGEDYNFLLSERETEFIQARDSLYMASVSESGWPYVQHRGGPAGFVKILDETTIGFANYSGNRQYVSTGNFLHDDRVALFFMDYPGRRRLKLLGRVEMVDDDDTDALERLEDDGYSAQVEQGMVIRVAAFDWNCPQHITPRFSAGELSQRNVPIPSASPTGTVPRTESGRQVPQVLGTGPLQLSVTGIRQLTPRVRGYELRKSDGRDLPSIDPGAHVRVPVTLADGSTTEKHYSIASDPARSDAWEIAVLRDENGSGGSDAIHATWQIGTRLRIDHPENHFALKDHAQSKLLIAGGIGITPLKAMAHTLISRDSPFTFHYAGRKPAEMAYLHELKQLMGNRLSQHCSDGGHRLDVGRTLKDIDRNTDIYVCGPDQLIRNVRTEAMELGFERQRVNFERFN